MSLSAFQYGSDDAGLVWGFLIDADGRTAPIGAPDATARLRRPAGASGRWHP
ncbi:MAG: magnesium transporter CorA, partial [Oxalobacteraceae bacterium]